MIQSYKLVGKIPVKCSFEDSGCMFDENGRKIEGKHIKRNIFGEVCVSTVFLPFNHSFDDSEIILFETMIFGGEQDGYMLRYSTFDEAVQGHEEVCYEINKVAIERNNKLNDLGV